MSSIIYLVSCNYFKQERYICLTHELCKNRNVKVFSDLVNTHNKYVLIGLSKYCKIVMTISNYDSRVKILSSIYFTIFIS
jgi:hypothetical protein